MNNSYTCDEMMTVEEFLKKMKIHPNGVLVVKNNIPLPIDEKLNPGDTIEILKVMSGG